MAEKDVKKPDPTAAGAQPAPENAAAQHAAPGDKKKAGKKARPGGDAGKLAALEAELETAKEKQAQLNDGLLRTAAEYENFRRRSQKEYDAAFGNGVSHAVVQLLPVLDTLEAAANVETTDAEYKKGVLLTLQKCEEIFKKLGIEEIDAEGQPFDPELHNACMQDTGCSCEAGLCTKVVQKGYKLGDKVIRHAMVAVSS